MSLRGLAALLGAFFALCAAGALVFALIDEVTAVRHAEWPVAIAMVRSAAVEQYHPFTREGGGTTYRVDVRAMFVARRRFVRARIASASSYRPAKMQAWVASHPLGSMIQVRYNPANPSDAEFADPPPLPRSYHPGVDLIIAAGFGVLAAVMLIASRQRKSLAL
jgi:uncharacterized protein DUF3592